MNEFGYLFFRNMKNKTEEYIEINEGFKTLNIQFERL